MKHVPISEAKKIAKSYDYDQVVIIARKVGKGGGEHVTTYGIDRANCDVAARIGTYLKARIFGWPEALKEITDRFLSWPLPRSVRSDLCVTEQDYNAPRYGTNLLTASEAQQMVEYITSQTHASK